MEQASTRRLPRGSGRWCTTPAPLSKCGLATSAALLRTSGLLCFVSWATCACVCLGPRRARVPPLRAAAHALL
eukprot:10917984-Lingulodinium_polyedra.AAC.1